MRAKRKKVRLLSSQSWSKRTEVEAALTRLANKILITPKHPSWSSTQYWCPQNMQFASYNNFEQMRHAMHICCMWKKKAAVTEVKAKWSLQERAPFCLQIQALTLQTHNCMIDIHKHCEITLNSGQPQQMILNNIECYLYLPWCCRYFEANDPAAGFIDLVQKQLKPEEKISMIPIIWKTGIDKQKPDSIQLQSWYLSFGIRATKLYKEQTYI